MKIGQKLFAGLGLVILLMILIGAFGLIGNLRIIRDFEGGGEELRAVATAATDISSHAKRVESHLVLYLILNSEEDRDKFFALTSELQEAFAVLAGRPKTPAEEKIVAELDHAISGLRPLGKELIRLHDIEISKSTRFEPQDHQETITRLYQSTSLIRKNGLALAALNLDQEAAIKKSALEHAGQLQQAILVVIGLSLSLAIFLCVRLAQGIVKPLTRLKRATTEIGLGNLEAEVIIHTEDEIGDLSRSLAKMAFDLHTSMVSRYYVDSIIRSMAEGLAVVSPVGKIEWVNLSLCRMLGYDSDELAKMPIESLFGDEPPWEGNNFAEAVDQGNLRGVEALLRKKIGMDLPVLFSASNLVSQEHQVIGAVCVAQDLSAQKEAEKELQRYRDDLELRVLERTVELKNSNDLLVEENRQRHLAEQALKKSEAQYRAIVEDQTELIRRCRPDRTITFVNNAFATYFGQVKESIIGNTCLNFIYEEDRAEVKGVIDNLKIDSPVVCYEHRVLLPDTKEIRWQQWISRLILDRDGKISEIQSVGRDVTDQKEMQRQLSRSAEKTKLFAFSVSHDLKNPAIAIYGLARRLKDKYGGVLDDHGQKICSQIYRSAEQINELVEKINVFIATKESPLNVEKINFSEILRMLEDEFVSQLTIRKITLQVPETVSWITADRLSILRVLRNLLDNALKYGGCELSRIVINHEETDEQHVFSVWNDGACIRPESAENIFGLFKRDNRDRGISGAGLGLAIVKEIAEQHRGRSWVESGQERGVTFYFSIAKKIG